MVITLVMDQYGLMNNGTTATARYFASSMRAHGHTVRIVTCISVNEQDLYVVKKRHYPLISKIISNQGMELAKPDAKVLREAIEGSDIVHFYLQFKLAKKGKEIADSMGIATTAAFHFQPENVSYNVGLRKSAWLNTCLYNYYRDFFDQFSNVHVPSEMMKSLLREHGYNSNIRAISNGVNPEFKKIEALRPSEYDGKYIIIMIGRLANEKRQDLLISAVGNSKYKDKIQIIFCGKGPKQKKLEKLSQKLLINPTIFKFVNRDELIHIINYSDLYVHTSEVESEAISCMEAFCCGLVPIISDAKMSATKQFALSERNIFSAGNINQLAEKIDWFIENPKEKEKMSEQYLDFAKNFTLEKCACQLEEMFVNAIEENKERLKNLSEEKEYVSKLSDSQIREYYEGKKKHNKEAIENGTPDYCDEYINTVIT